MADPAGPPRPPLPALAAVGLLTAFALYQAVALNNFQDFFIYRTGAALGLRGESPYDPVKVRAAVAAQYPGDADDPTALVNNCAFLLPPQAVVLFAPFAAVPYPVAKVLWAAANGLAAAAALLALRTFGGRPPTTAVGQLLPVLLLLNPLTAAVVVVGQTPILSAGCVAAGQWCFERGRPAVGAGLWAAAFVKPHVALALLPLAWYVGGWRRLAAVVGAVAALNLAGALIVAGTPRVVLDYAAFLGAGHRAVAYNLAELNPQITSWNRLLSVATGGRVLVEQAAGVTLAGYAVWFGLAAARAGLAGGRPSGAWVAAICGVGAVFCPQVLGSEAVILVLAVPWVRRAVGDRPAVGWLAAAALAAHAVPAELFAAAGVTCHRPAAVALLAALVLAGPVGGGAAGQSTGR